MIASPREQQLPQRTKPPPWAHFIAGAAGGISATIVTAPLDVVKTRLQSTLYANGNTRNGHRTNPGIGRLVRRAGWHVQETLSMIVSLGRHEGPSALFRGLGPNLAGYVPSTGLKFLCYGNAKSTLVAISGQESVWTHLCAGIIAGVFTCTATNPFWVIKTRLQLDHDSAPGSTHSRKYKNSLDCLRQTLQHEGIKGLYRGLSASYVGTVETALQWVLYEQFKAAFRSKDGTDERTSGGLARSINEAAAAGLSKLIAAVALYPHEVLRTRLREAPKPGEIQSKVGLRQCFQHILAKEGITALYGGLTPHLLRVVPSSAVVFSVYEAVLRLSHPRTETADALM